MVVGLNFQKNTKNHTARYYIKQIEQNPEQFGVTKSHISSINSALKKTAKELEKNLMITNTPNTPHELKLGLIVRANGRIGIITGINDVIRIKFPTGTEKEYPQNRITFCRDQTKAMNQYQIDVERRQK